MSEPLNMILTASLTICGATLTLVFGQIVIKFYIEPLHSQFMLVGQIAHSLSFFANVYGSRQYASAEAKARAAEASGLFRQQATQLRATTRAIRAYRFWLLLGFVPQKTDVANASKGLVALSNVIDDDADPAHIYQLRTKIAKSLAIDINS